MWQKAEGQLGRSYSASNLHYDLIMSKDPFHKLLVSYLRKKCLLNSDK